MSAACPCHNRPVKRTGTVTAGLLSGLALLLMPKCPACVAAYIALGTGIGLTTSTVGHLRFGLILICSSLLFISAFRLLSSFGLPTFSSLWKRRPDAGTKKA